MKMDIKNYLLKKKQLKSIKQSDGDLNFYNQLPYHCPKCYFGTDTLSEYTTHLENHLIKKMKKKNDKI